VETIVIPDRETGGWEIEAEKQIAHVSSEWGNPEVARNEPRLRWGENTVWRLAGRRWALYRASMSVIYHTPDTECRIMGPDGPGTGQRRGTACKARDMPEEVEPCWHCHPPEPEQLPGDADVRFEFPRQSVVIFTEPERLARALFSHRKVSGDEVVALSGPARALLEQCRENDPDFAAGMGAQRMVKIS
jgi:hypothetical protein